jgi:predicted transcriptional regulator
MIMAKTAMIGKNIYLPRRLADEVSDLAKSIGRSDSWVYSQAIEIGLKAMRECKGEGVI